MSNYDRSTCPKCKHGKLELMDNVKFLSSSVDISTCPECKKYFALSEHSALWYADDLDGLMVVLDRIDKMKDDSSA